MDDCPHPELTPTAQTFALNEGDQLVARTVHLQVRCVLCGWPFRFVGSFNSPPTTREGIAAATEPWVSWGGEEIGFRLMPLDGVDAPSVGLVAGHA